MIRIEQLRKRFGPLQVLDGVDLVIAPGRVTAVVGPNGAGKTTLIKSILGLTRADSGRVTIDDRPVDRGRIGYMPQIARFPENLTAADLFAMMTDLRSVPGAKSVDCDSQLIDRLGLGTHLHKPLRVLSGGTRQKVNAALAFLFRPDVLFLDEPTAGLDPVSSAIVKDRVLAERDAGRTFVLTSHVMSELEELADDVAFLVDGRIRYAGSIHDLKKMTRQLSLERAVAHVIAQDLGSGRAA